MFLGVGDKLINGFADELNWLSSSSIDGLSNTIIFNDFFWSDNKRITSYFKIQRGLMGFPHSGTIFPSFLFKNSFFDTNYRIAADLDWLLKNLDKLETCQHHKFSNPMVQLKIGGISMSRKNKFMHLYEFLRVCWKNKVFPSWKFIFLKIFG